MKIGIISDIHSNLESLEASLNYFEKEKIDKLIIIGDVIGYGPDPNDCIELVKKNADIILKGNHEDGILKNDFSRFKKYARISLEWTIKEIEEKIEEIKLWEDKKEIDDFIFLHASISDIFYKYILKVNDAEEEFERMDKNICFIGHTHIPCGFKKDEESGNIEKILPDFSGKIDLKIEELGYEGVELRTQHKHNVEANLTKKERQEVRKKFENSSVKLVGLGTCFEFHSPDKEELRRNIEGTKEYVILARDVGAEGVKVRPNAFPKDVPKEKTIEQIGKSLREVSYFASDYGVKIRLEVHGQETSNPVYIKQMIDIADSPNLYVCWNSNMTDLDETGSIEKNFNLLKDRIDVVHINELWNDYPWLELFKLLRGINFKNFCLAEILSNPEPERILRYYKALFNAYLEIVNLRCLQKVD